MSCLHRWAGVVRIPTVSWSTCSQWLSPQRGLPLGRVSCGVSHFLAETSVSSFLQISTKESYFHTLRSAPGDAKGVSQGPFVWYLLPTEVAQSCPILCDPWTVAYQAPPSMGFSKQECWSGLPFPSPGDLPGPGIKPGSPALQADALPSEPPGKPPYQPYLRTALIRYPAFELLSGGKHTEPVPDTWPSWSFPLIISKSSGWHLWWKAGKWGKN